MIHFQDQSIDTSSATTIQELVAQLRYKENWQFFIDEDFLRIKVVCDDSTGRYPKQLQVKKEIFWADRFVTEIPVELNGFYVIHTFPLPHKDYFGDDVALMRRWLLDQVFNVEKHEAMEFFKLPNPNTGKYEAPYFPHSGDLNRSPYTIVDQWDSQ